MRFSFIPFIFVLAAFPLSAATLEVGDGKPFQRIENAVAQAKPGDEIVVHPKRDGSPYRQPAVQIHTAKLTIRTAAPDKPVVLDGEGFTYSGVGSVPRAIFQFNLGADGCVLDGFTLINARNESNNGAGVRINQANDVIIRNCIIRNNDMGIMSNGEVSTQTGARQLIDKCKITDNGTMKEPGQNHNLYLGGTSVMVRESEVARAVAGHNVKSRAHLNYIVGSHIHSSRNREFDLVDGIRTTDVPGSDSFIVGNLIEKDPNCPGNKAVIHFGRDGSATHNGMIWIIGNTIRTPFITSVVDFSSGNGVVFLNNEIDDMGARQRCALVAFRNQEGPVSGKDNKIPERFIIRSLQGEEMPVKLVAPPAIPRNLPEPVRSKIDSL